VAHLTTPLYWAITNMIIPTMTDGWKLEKELLNWTILHKDQFRTMIRQYKCNFGIREARNTKPTCYQCNWNKNSLHFDTSSQITFFPCILHSQQFATSVSIGDLDRIHVESK